MHKPLFALVAAVLLSLAPFAHAYTTYTYTGQNFTSASGDLNLDDHVSGTFTTAAPLAANESNELIVPTTFSFTDGAAQVSNNSDDVSYTFDLSTNASGMIISWDILLSDDEYINFLISPSGDSADDYIYGRGSNSLSGTFTSDAPLPTSEPSTFALLGTGMLGAACILRRRCCIHS